MTISNVQIRRLQPFYKRVLVNQLGTPVRAIPKKVADINKLLEDYNTQDPTRVAEMFDVVVHGKVTGQTLPSDIAETVERAKRELVATIKQTTVEEVISLSEARIREMQDAAGADLIRHAKEAITRAADNYRPIIVKTGKKTKKLTGVFPAEFERMVQLASARVPIMMVGPAGCGKTYLGGKIAEALGLKFADQSMSEGVSESVLTGWLLPVGANGRFEYVASPFIDAYEKGGVFLFDEIDASDANLLTFLNKAIANDNFMLPQRYKKPLVKKHQDFVPIAAANTFGAGADAQYVGRNALDAATLDRYRAGMITMDYSAPVEEALVDAEVLEWGRKIRRIIRDRKLFRIMSTRVMLDLTKMKSQYDWGQEDWEEAYLADWSVEEKRMVA